jgi:hypothetical protein
VNWSKVDSDPNAMLRAADRQFVGALALAGGALVAGLLVVLVLAVAVLS